MKETWGRPQKKDKMKDVDAFLKEIKISTKLKSSILHNLYLTLLKFTGGAVRTKIKSNGREQVLE